MVEKLDPEAFRRYAVESQRAARRRMAVYRHLSLFQLSPSNGNISSAAEQPAGTVLEQSKEV
jgi:hypothetical protein